MEPILSNVNLIVLAFFFSLELGYLLFHSFNFDLLKFLWCKYVSSVQIKNKNKHDNLFYLLNLLFLYSLKFLIYLDFYYLCLLFNCSTFSLFPIISFLSELTYISLPSDPNFCMLFISPFRNSRLLILHRILIMHYYLNTFLVFNFLRIINNYSLYILNV